MPACAKCGDNKPRGDFSKSQFKKPANNRNCKACCGSATSTVQVVIRCYHCKKVQPEGEKFFQCRGCRSITYCGKKCQKADWHAGHKEVCGELNLGDAEQIVPTRSKALAEDFKNVLDLVLRGENGTLETKKFFDLFLQSEDQDDDQLQRTAESMKKWFRPQNRVTKTKITSQSMFLLTTCPTKMLKLSTSPLTIVLACHFDPNTMSRPYTGRSNGHGLTFLHLLAEFADGSKRSSFRNQVKIGQQLIDAGADVNGRAEHRNFHCTPLHRACSDGVTTNIDFVKLLLDNGADINAQDNRGWTPLVYCMPYAAGAAKLLVQSNGIDLNIKTEDGITALAMVRCVIGDIEQAEGNSSNKFIVSQLKELEEMMVVRGAHDTGTGVE